MFTSISLLLFFFIFLNLVSAFSFSSFPFLVSRALLLSISLLVRRSFEIWAFFFGKDIFLFLNPFLAGERYGYDGQERWKSRHVPAFSSLLPLSRKVQGGESVKKSPLLVFFVWYTKTKINIKLVLFSFVRASSRCFLWQLWISFLLRCRNQQLFLFFGATSWISFV